LKRGLMDTETGVRPVPAPEPGTSPA
jgi:hypothetical protein